MRLLYIANHAVLEYDELRIFGLFCESVFSTWFYRRPDSPSADVRPPLHEFPVNHEALEIWERKGLDAQSCLQDTDFLSRFDVIVSVHNNTLLPLLAAVSIPVFIRTIGQSLPVHEARLSEWRNRYKIVRYSPKERAIDKFAGEDAMIRFGKFASDFEPWQGGNGQVSTFYGGIPRRKLHASFDLYSEITEPFERVLWGGNNGGIPWATGILPNDEVAKAFSRSSLYYCCHTVPASYTLNLMEAMITGCPIVTPGKALLAGAYEAVNSSPECYEGEELLENSILNVTPSSVPDARKAIRLILEDADLARRLGEANRQRGLELFDASKIATQWQDALNRSGTGTKSLLAPAYRSLRQFLSGKSAFQRQQQGR